MGKIKQLSPIQKFMQDYHARYESELSNMIDKAFSPRNSPKAWSEQLRLREESGLSIYNALNVAKDTIKKAMERINEVIERGLRGRKPEEKQIIMGTTQRELLKLLEKYKGVRKELYEEIRKYIKDIFQKQFKNEFKNDLDAIFPPQAFSGAKHDAACQAFVAAITTVLAVHGITPCNGYNHGFCFCGWGGTRQTHS